jgi:uncharacterized protein YqjF (DUF2071 family)
MVKLTGRQRMFTADWLDVIFVHYRIDPAHLAPLVPLPLDLHDGDAYVSLVAFTQSRLRPTIGGRLSEILASPLGQHEFLNVRTYVRHGAGAGDRGIYFMTEWIPNRLAAFIGPRTYGLPYRLGRLNYDGMSREIEAAGRRLTIRASVVKDADGDTNGLTHFLLERYIAFTHRNGVTRRFDVDHAPWPYQRVEVDVDDSGLLPLSGEWFQHAQFAAAHHSSGVRDVAISAPWRVLPASPRQPLGA